MFSRGSLKASMPATPCYFAWGCFRYFSWEREPRRPCGCLSRDDRRVACRAVARVQRSPPSPDGLWRGSLRYEMACPAGQTAKAGGEGVSQSPLKDKAFSAAFLDQKPPSELRARNMA